MTQKISHNSSLTSTGPSNVVGPMNGTFSPSVDAIAVASYLAPMLVWK